MASKTQLIARKVPVEVVQQDMESSLSSLRYPVAPLLGDCFFTEKVLWGEIWLKDLSKRGTLWRGYIKDGQLYLDETTRKGLKAVTKPNRGVIPSLITPGKYKVWLDAFVRLGDFSEIYKDDVLTIDNEYDPAVAQWTARSVPHSKYWPVVHVGLPLKGKPARMVVPSCRFHWLYRLSRLLGTL